MEWLQAIQTADFINSPKRMRDARDYQNNLHVLLVVFLASFLRTLSDPIHVRAAQNVLIPPLLSLPPKLIDVAIQVTKIDGRLFELIYRGPCPQINPACKTMYRGIIDNINQLRGESTCPAILKKWTRNEGQP